MDASALAEAAKVFRSSIANTESSISGFETIGNWASIVVLVGCAVEISVICHEYWDDLTAFWRDSIKTPERPSGRLLFLNIFGTALVVVGIGGELWASLKVQALQGDLQTENRGVTQLFENAFTDTFKEAAQLQKRAEDEALARAAIEDSVEWRSLDPKEQRSLGSHLQQFSGQVAGLAFQVNDTEAERFAKDIALALKSGGWSVPDDPLEMLRLREGPLPFGTTRILATGVLVRSTGDVRSEEASAALIRELTSRGFDTHTEELMNAARPLVGLFVGHRPLGPQGAAKFRKAKVN